MMLPKKDCINSARWAASLTPNPTKMARRCCVDASLTNPICLTTQPTQRLGTTQPVPALLFLRPVTSGRADGLLLGIRRIPK